MAPAVASKTPPLSPCSPPRKKAKFSLCLKGKKTKDEENDKLKPNNVCPIFSSPSEGRDENYDGNNLDREPEMPSLPHAGLLNQGNTCYANAVLQVLRCCPGFEQLVGHLASKGKDNMKDEQSIEKRDESEELITRLEELLCQMCMFEEDFVQDQENCIHLSEKGNNLVLAAETFKFMDAFREIYPAFENNLQHDAQEFLCSLIMALQEVATNKVKKDKKHNCSQTLCSKKSDAIESKYNIFNVSDVNGSITCCMEHLFQGKLVHQTKCLNCEESKLRYEDFQDVSVPVVEDQPYLDARKKLMLSPTPKKSKESIHTLQWAISQFASSECLQGDNKYFCENCHTYCEAEIRTCFEQLPGVLIIHLKRFTSSIGLSSKITSNLQTPFVLSVQEWCSKKCQRGSNVYELFGIVVHSGMTSGSGHYETYVRLYKDQYKNHQATIDTNDDVQNLNDMKNDVNGSCLEEKNNGKCTKTRPSCNGIESVLKTDINGNCVFEESEEKCKSNDGKSKRKRSRKSENENMKAENGTEAEEKNRECSKESKRKKLGESSSEEAAESPFKERTQQTSCMSVITRYFNKSSNASSGKKRSSKNPKNRAKSQNNENISNSNKTIEENLEDDCSKIKENESLKNNEDTSHSSKNVGKKLTEDCSEVKENENLTNNEKTSNLSKNDEEKPKENYSDVEENEEKPREALPSEKPKGCASIEHYFKKNIPKSRVKNTAKSPAMRKLNFQGNSEKESLCNRHSALHEETEAEEGQNSSSDEELQSCTDTRDESLKTGWVHFDDCTVASLSEQDIVSILSSSDSSFTSPYLLFYRKIELKGD